jgi:hypothetical protein
MEQRRNSVLLEAVLNAIYHVASRRTSEKSADETLGSTIKTLERKYDFLRYVSITQRGAANQGFGISVSPDIDSVDSEQMGKAIEALIRLVYNDLSEEAGLYFVTELKQLAGDDVSRGLMGWEADLDQVQLEQHYAYRRRKRKKNIQDASIKGALSHKRPDNLIGYTWGTVSHWKHEPGSKYCVLYDKQGNMLDRLNLDRIIQNYVERLSGYIDIDPLEVEKEAKIYEKEYELLKLLLERDMDAETAMVLLNISRDELNNIIQKLTEMEMLQHIDFSTMELTETGISFLAKKDKTKQ